MESLQNLNAKGAKVAKKSRLTQRRNSLLRIQNARQFNDHTVVPLQVDDRLYDSLESTSSAAQDLKH
jgi:hypothetical protein